MMYQYHSNDDSSAKVGMANDRVLPDIRELNILVLSDSMGDGYMMSTPQSAAFISQRTVLLGHSRPSTKSGRIHRSTGHQMMSVISAGSLLLTATYIEKQKMTNTHGPIW